MDSRHGLGKHFVTLTVTFLSLLITGRVDAMPLYTLTSFGSALPQGIDDAGDVVLAAGNYTGANPYNGVYHSYGPSAGQITPPSAYGVTNYVLGADIRGIVNSGTVFGQIPVGNAGYAFISSGGQVTDLGTLPGYQSSAAVAANASGVVVGDASTPTGSYTAFVYSNGQMTGIGTLGGAFSGASAINSSGQVIGSSTTSNGTAAAVRGKEVQP